MGYHDIDSSDYSDTNDVQIKSTHICTFEGCGALFTKKSKLTNHLYKHTGERPFACDQPGCTKAYTNSSHLRRHKKVFHEKHTEEIVCPFEGCGITLSNRYILKKHISRKHNPDRKFPFQCSICQAGFGKKTQLQNHTYQHTGIATFSCDQCNLKFKSSFGLHRHKRQHKTYNCQKCKTTFNLWSVFLHHRRNCRMKWLFCTKCGKSFDRTENYKSHVATHNDIKKRFVYACPREDCKRFYFYKKNLVFHIKKFHEKEQQHLQLKCSYGDCNAILKTRLTHKRHLLRHSMEKKKVIRRARKDKGTKKYSMAGLLSGMVIENIKLEENESWDNNV